MFSTPQQTATSKYHFILLMTAIFSIWCQCCYAKFLPFTRGLEHHNPNAICAGKNVENIWYLCEHGGYIAENSNPKNCGDRYLCYKGLNESCTPKDKCADNAVCTMCGKCQKCDSAENCSEFELCPNYYGYQTINNIKRFLQKRYGKINSQ